ncbi:MAG: Ig-like domain-containing protein [Thermoplasmatota archaeon]
MQPSGKRLLALLAVSLFMLTMISPMVFSGPPSRKIDAPSLQQGTYLEWSYSEWSPDGTSSRTGVQTASVATGIWNSMDIFKVSGTITGEFVTPDGTGDESGTWEAYYKQDDLSMVRSTRELTRVVDGSGISGTNSSSTDIDLPYFRWVKFPLRSDAPQTSWTDEVRSITSWTLTSGGSTIDSGTSDETYVHWRYCSNQTTLSLGGTIHDVYVVKEMKETEGMETVHNSTLYYSDAVGWWVKWETYAPYGEGNVLVQELVLKTAGDNSPPVASEIPDITIDEDEVYSDLDPNLYFTDPDGDALDYSASDTAPLEVDIDGDSIVIVPPANEHGTFSFNLSATDRQHDPVSSEVTVIVNPVDDPHELSMGGVDPERGDIDTVFEFRITVRDIEGDVPAVVNVFVDGSRNSMEKGSGDILSGAVYSWSGTLAEGSHSYHFEVDGQRLPGTGEYSGPMVTSPEDPVLYGPSLDLEEGNTDTLFTFTIHWKDPRGRMPDDVYLFVDDGEELVDGMATEGTDPSSGVEFRTSTMMSSGSHSYYFLAEIDGSTFRYPRNGELMGPDVYDPQIILDGYIPEGPFEGDDVTFFVHFRYGLGRSPDVQKVVVDGDEFTLDIESGDPIDGMNLTRTMKLDKGTHTYRFEIEIDGREIVTSERTLRVNPQEPVDDDDDIDIETDKGSGPGVFVLIVILLLLVVLGVAAFFMIRYRPPKKPSEEFEEDGASEGHVGNVRGL